MKRERLLAVVLIAVMMSGGCGNKNAEEATTDTNVVNSSVSEEEQIKENETEETQSFTSVKEEMKRASRMSNSCNRIRNLKE